MAHPAMERCDMLFRNATVIDGTGQPRVQADVAIAADRVVAVGDLAGTGAEREVDCSGRVLAPGFIDAHTHDDRALMLDRAMDPKLTQGVTTVVIGNCGLSLAPLTPGLPPPPPLDLLGEAGDFRYPSYGSFLAALEDGGLPANAVPMVGHTTLRVAAMAELGRAASDREIAAMQALVRESLDAGAVGLSTGLFYPPANAAPMEEVVALLEALSGTGAIYATHMRDEGDDVADSLEETFETARRAGVPVVVSHHKCSGRNNFGRSRETLALFDRALARQDVGLDAYPYAASSTVLLDDYMEKADRVMIAWSEPHPEASGRYLDEIAAEWDCALRDALGRLKPGGAIYFILDEADVRRILAYPHTMIGSDGLPHDRHPHPRLWGTFPRVLGHYARDVGLFGLEEAVHKMTGKTAARFGLRDRGVVRPGAFADLVLFDPGTVTDRASFEEPAHPAAGIEMVLVNGQPVLDNGRLTRTRAGRVLRRDAH